MGKSLKAISLPLLLVTVICLSVIAGCQPPVSQEETEQILAEAISILENIDSYKASLDLRTNLDVIGGTEEGSVSYRMLLEAVVDRGNSASELIFNIIIGRNVRDAQDAAEENIETYLFGDYIYAQLPTPDAGLVWYKAPVSENSIDTYDIDIIDQQILPLESPAGIKALRYESYGGSECLVIEVVPDKKNMIGWISELKVTDLPIGPEDLELLKEILKDPTYILWIAEDTGYIKKVTGEIRLEISPSDFNLSEDFFDEMTIDTTLNIEIFEYNQSVNIELPEAALDAKELAF